MSLHAIVELNYIFFFVSELFNLRALADLPERARERARERERVCMCVCVFVRVCDERRQFYGLSLIHLYIYLSINTY